MQMLDPFVELSLEIDPNFVPSFHSAEAKYYTGIGSRSTPPDILRLMIRIGFVLDCLGFTLRSGAADGADLAFESRVLKSQIFVPWPGFSDRDMYWDIPNHAFYLASLRYGYVWSNMGRGTKALQARNMQQVLGPELDEPSKFVICWTKDGAEHARQVSYKTGGTGSAIFCASNNAIEVINLYNPGWQTRLSEYADFDFNTLEDLQ